MKKFFVFSDAHSFLEPLKTALDKAGFDPNNKDHWIVSCGDLFDRGPDSEELFHYIMSIDRKILVKGNHDFLLDECCKREFPYMHDISNGTMKTINDIGGAGEGRDFAECCSRTYDKLAAYRDALVNYFETEHYIFVHSWLPISIRIDETASNFAKVYMENWRNADSEDWYDAMWGNPFNAYLEGLNKTDKTIVFGHWHCSAGHRLIGNCQSEFEDDAIWEPFYGDTVIGIDRCTAHTHEVNVIILEDNFVEKAG